MARFSSTDELVTLPRMSATDAIALGTVLEAAAQAVMSGPPLRKLPGSIGPKLQRMTEARDAISGAMRGRIQPGDDEAPQAKETDRILDNVWGGTRDLCTAYLRLPRNADTGPVIDSAGVLMEALFKNGLEFTKYKYRLQWVESKHRLDLVEEKSLGVHFDRLGAGVFLTELRAAHEMYGKVLGLTDAAPAEDSDVRQSLDGFRAALKRYVVGVNGYADPDIPGSEELAEKLLAPLNDWKPTTATARSKPEAPAGEPVDEPA